MRVYLDNAATTPLSPSVIEAMTDCLKNHYGNPSSTHKEGRSVRVVIERARKTIAKHLNASIGEIFFTSGGTESNNMAIRCSVRDLGVRRIISSATEHHCVLHTLDALKRESDVEVVFLDCDQKGQSDLQQLDKMLGESNVPTLVTLMHANNEIGTVNNLYTISEICKGHNAFLHSDSVQTMGHLPIDVSDLKIQFMSGSAHKFHGPKGAGFIYINNDIKIHPFIEGGGQERNMRAGTENVYGIRGLEVSFDEACQHMNEHRDYITNLRNYLKSRLIATFEDIQFNGVQTGEFLYTILNVSFPPSPKNEMMLMNLDIEGISASGGSACSSGAEVGSHVMHSIGADPERKAVRFSLSRFNTKQEIDFVVEKLKKIVPTRSLEIAK